MILPQFKKLDENGQMHERCNLQVQTQVDKENLGIFVTIKEI